MLILLACVAALAAMAWADQRGWLLAGRDDDLLLYDQRTATVLRVLDDGLLEVDMPDSLHGAAVSRIRIWGVALPDDPTGAREWLEANCHGMPIMLDLEPHRTRDVRGDLLVHITLPNGESLAAVLLRNGLAIRDERWPHAHLIEYAQHEQVARLGGIGCWAQ